MTNQTSPGLRWIDGRTATGNTKLAYWSGMIERLMVLESKSEFENYQTDTAPHKALPYYDINEEYGSLVFDMYLPEAYTKNNENTRIWVVFQSTLASGSENARMSIKLDWTGWKTIEIPFDDKTLNNNASQLDYLSSIHLNTKGTAALYGDPNAQVFIGQMYLKPKTAE